MNIKLMLMNTFTDTEINQAMENKNNLKIEVKFPVVELKDVLYSKTGFEEVMVMCGHV